MFSKILIANRGEIACRVIRSAQQMGIRTIAVFSEADRHARHVAAADEAYLIGPAPAAESYLCQDKILAVAKRAGAEAIHPGYGFLSENASFAQACADAGIVFIGPSPQSIEVMGSKALSKDLMAKAGVPLSPGYQGEDQSVSTFVKEAARIGYPVLLKATAGGGGKGMRIVEGEADLEEALAAAKREAMNAFGDDRFLVEKFIPAPRHIEVQVFGDTHGNVVHLYERDCSVQRRYQKVVEEAPAPALPDDVRERLLKAGVEAARAVNYVGAGTVEFLYDGHDAIYFMEMNTRLQVEHPVTEEITGLDLVEWQLRVAAGETLPLEQDQIYCDGHAVEVRLYAEDPAHDFRPSIGALGQVEMPSGEGIRVDSGVAAGAEVSPFYDPMIAKLIANGDDRRSALARLDRALARTHVAPLVTNLGFLRRVVTSEPFQAGGVTTKFLDEHPTLSEGMEPAPEILALVALGLARTSASEGPCADEVGAWRLNQPQRVFLRLTLGGQVVPVTLDGGGLHWTGQVGEAAVRLAEVSYADLPDAMSAVVDDGLLKVQGDYDGLTAGRWFQSAHGPFTVGFFDPGIDAEGQGADAAGFLAPMPSTVTSVAVQPGDSVTAGQILMTLEAMKMETPISAPADGTVTDVLFAVGDTVGEGARLIGFEPS
ncbi:MAG: acetyl/propionyl/methylcrotonyl-CoA carboxylase subunit alpha [Parvularcula sp.]